MIEHKCNDDGLGVYYNNSVMFREVYASGGQLFYKVMPDGSFEVNHLFGLNKVYNRQQVQHELELGKGGVTCSCTCSVCGSIAAIRFAAQARSEDWLEYLKWSKN